MKRSLLLFAFSFSMFASECHLSTVQYTESVKVTDPDLDNPEKLLPAKTAFGCVFHKGSVLIVIQDFSGDRPVSVLAIPTGAVIKITGLKDDVAQEESFQKLPTVPNAVKGVRSKELI